MDFITLLLAAAFGGFCIRAAISKQQHPDYVRIAGKLLAAEKLVDRWLKAEADLIHMKCTIREKYLSTQIMLDRISKESGELLNEFEATLNAMKTGKESCNN